VASLLAATIGELCRGQVLELQHLFDVDRSEEDYASAIEGKTAALFATSCRIGGMVTGLAGGSITIKNNGGDAVVLAADGMFTFPTHVAASAGRTSSRASTPVIYALPESVAQPGRSRRRALEAAPSSGPVRKRHLGGARRWRPRDEGGRHADGADSLDPDVSGSVASSAGVSER
jgi:hypothetical protein